MNFSIALRALYLRYLRHSCCTFLMICGAFSFVAPSRAQDLDDATISGRVLDLTGAAIPGVTVMAKLKTSNTERSITSNEQGRFRIIDLEPGTYDIVVSNVSKPCCFVGQILESVELLAGQNLQYDFTLQIQGLELAEIVINSDAAPAVDTTRTVVGGTVTETEIESLPSLTRAPLDFVFTLPGVSEEALSTRGAAEDRNSNTRARRRKKPVISALAAAPRSQITSR
jgi:hypothetical protein